VLLQFIDQQDCLCILDWLPRVSLHTSPTVFHSSS
jgi:hypothetical protein